MKPTTILVTTLKILGLVLLLSLERVVGLPLLFVLLGLIWLDQIREKTYSYSLLLLFLSYLVSVFYNLIWPVVFLIWLITGFLISYSASKYQAKNKRFFVVTILQNLFWLWWVKLPVGYLTVIQFVMSYLLVIMWMRILRLKKN